MSRVTSRAEIKYHMLDVKGKERIIECLRERLGDTDGVVFAYVHGGFVERDLFRDVDVAVWIKNAGEAFKYEVDLSAELEVEFKIPIDIHVLNGAPLTFKHQTFTKGKILFSKDERLRIGLVDETLRMYADVRMLNAVARHYEWTVNPSGASWEVSRSGQP